MRGDQLARQWRILRPIESKKQGTTVAELAAQEDCSSRTIWRDLAAIQAAGFSPLGRGTNHFPICTNADTPHAFVIQHAKPQNLIEKSELGTAKKDIAEIERMLKALIRSLENKHLHLFKATAAILGLSSPTGLEKNRLS